LAFAGAEAPDRLALPFEEERMTEQSSGQSPVQGWYTDPHDASRLRWWDGASWTDHVHPPAGGEPAAAAQAPQAATPASGEVAVAGSPDPAASAGPRSAIAEWFSIRSNQVLFVVLLIAIALFVYVMVGGAS
jgi:hypothetical protein